MKVKNLNGSSRTGVDGKALLAYWESACRQNAFLCSVNGCINRPSSAGLVQKDSVADRAWYVVALCEACCSTRFADLDIWDAAQLVSAPGAVTSAAHRLGTSAGTGHSGVIA
jgi:hypothetical protein